MPDHVHVMISIPPKYAVPQVVGYLRGKSTIHIACTCSGRKRDFVGQHYPAQPAAEEVLTAGARAPRRAGLFQSCALSNASLPAMAAGSRPPAMFPRYPACRAGEW